MGFLDDLDDVVRADSWRRDGSEFLSIDVWTRIWRKACDTAGLPEEFTPYNACHEQDTSLTESLEGIFERSSSNDSRTE